MLQDTNRGDTVLGFCQDLDRFVGVLCAKIPTAHGGIVGP